MSVVHPLSLCSNHYLFYYIFEIHREYNITYNNNRVYCHNNISYKAKFVGDTKTFEICFIASICFCLSLFNILCMDGIADCMYLLLYPLLILRISLCLVCILCLLELIGKRCPKFSTFRLFFANFKQRMSLLTARLTMPNSFRMLL